MQKIIICNDLVYGGGVENVMLNLVRYLSKKDYDITVIGDGCTQEEFCRFYPESVRYYSKHRVYQRGKKYSLKWFLTGVMLVLEDQFYRFRLPFMSADIAIAMKEGPCMVEMSKVKATKKYAWVHTDYHFMHWTSYCFSSNEEEKKMMSEYNNVICVSHAAKDSVIDVIGDPGNLVVRYNPLDVSTILRLSKAKPDVLNINSGVPVIVTVGRLSPQKKIQLLLEAVYDLEKKYGFEMLIVGDGPDRKELEEIIHKRNIQSVRLLGKKNNPYPYIKMADFYVSSSTWESYGLAIQEALILGKPVVAVRCPAIAETLDTRFGILTDNSKESLCDGIEKLLANPELLEEKRNNIANDYMLSDLYKNRLDAISTLWENEL